MERLPVGFFKWNVLRHGSASSPHRHWSETKSETNTAPDTGETGGVRTARFTISFQWQWPRASVPAVIELRVPVSSVTIVTGNLAERRRRGFVARPRLWQWPGASVAAVSELRVPVNSVTVVTVFRNALSSSAARVRASITPVAEAGMLASCFKFIITLRVRLVLCTFLFRLKCVYCVSN
jgi:hypothetical protein